LLYASTWSIANTTVSGDRLLLSQQQGNKGRVLVMDKSGAVLQTVVQDNVLLAPRQALLLQNEVWVADSLSGLLRFAGPSAEPYRPNSPLSIALGEMVACDGTLWVASGAVTAAWANTFTKNGLYRFAGETWTNYNKSSLPVFDSLYDIITVAADPTDNSAWAGSFGGGLLHLANDNTLQVFKQNSPLPSSAADPTKYYIAGLAFDGDNNLWIASYGGRQPLSVKKADGSWRSFSPPFVISGNAVSQVVTDDYNQVWMVSPANGLLCFNRGASVDNPADDKWKLYQPGAGSGNLPSAHVLCIARDKNSFIWVGTDHGIGIIQCGQDVFSAQGCDAVLPVVQQDNFAGYLFSDEQVQCIATDGADRKWVGTKNGVWLLSADGQQILYRFTVTNSPLLNNDVRKIAIDGKSGEVFFATASGICSFRSTATDGGATNSNVLVFPNPVPPGYNGSIAIRGLADNATVKITELNGRLVYETRALGGQAIWNGKDYNGRNIATGVYLVLVSDDSRQQKTATKIVFISK
ncbi:MAG TPA: two-component regulator propeller domain-containing protein, partial [Chitinophagaceae bacterium]|nr:two-component regulator propeller domain-containing protein [Chitinophagaceae bacterium]